MPIDTANLVLALCLGLGLSAACGFRVFIPPLALSVAAMQGIIDLAPDWQWLSSPAAVTTLAIAACIEVVAYWIPWVSNALDMVELVAAPIAGMLMTASSLSLAGDISPILLWTTAAIVGGGTAELVEGATTMTRFAAATATGGCGGPVVGLLEFLSAAVLSLLAIFAPFLALLLVIGLAIYCGRRLQRWRSRRQRHSSPAPR